MAVDQQVVLGAELAAVCGVRAGQAAPRLARTLNESRQARDQSSWPWRPSASSSRWCSRCQTPARCQSRRRRQQVTGLPQPSSRVGNSRQGCRCAAGKRCLPGRRGRRRGDGRRSGVVGWAAAVGSPATAVRGQGCRQWSWPRIMPLTSASSKSRSKLGNMLLRPAVDSRVAIELGPGGWRSGLESWPQTAQVIGPGVYCLARIQNDRGGWQPGSTT
jgi:hypothetical protein